MRSVNRYRKREVARAFGSALRTARIQRRLSQDKLSEICEFDRTYPSLLERGLRSPTICMLLRLADALGLEPAQLVNCTVEQLRQEESLRT